MNRNLSIGIGKRDLDNYGLVLVETPIWFGRMGQSVRVFLKKYRGKIKNIGFFCARDGYTDAAIVFKQMSQLVGRSPAVTFRVCSSETKSETFRTKVAQPVERVKPIEKRPERQPPPPEIHTPMN